jgi:two-component system alkaline phosphatase synthesis response regulator PhoP
MVDRPSARLLVVEDEPTLGATLVERLTRSGFEVTWARTVAAAQAELAKHPFDLALLDVGLPDGSGFLLAEVIRKQAVGMAIIFLTAMVDPQHRILGLELGAEDYVVKPFNYQELVLRIENGLRRARFCGTGLNRMWVGRARVNFPAFSAEVDGETTTLSQRETALLKLLVENRGSVVSRDQILDEVWSRDDYPTPRTVDNFILKLRRLVETDPETPTVIRSVRGVGYQLNAEACREL